MKVIWKVNNKVGKVNCSFYCTGMNTFYEVEFEDCKKYIQVNELIFIE